MYNGESDEVLDYPVTYYWLAHAKLAPEDIIEKFHTSHSFCADESEPRKEWRANWSMHPLQNQTDVSALHVATIAGDSGLVDHH